MVKNRIVYMIGLIGLSLFYIYCNSYTPLAILIVFVSLTVFGILTSLLSAAKIVMEIRPTYPYTTQRKDRQAEFCVSVQNNSIFPISVVAFEVEFQDLSDGGVVKRKIKAPLAAKENKEIYTSVTTSHTALIECRIRKPRVYDAFGLFHFVIKNISDSSKLLISPLMADGSYIQSQDNSYILDSDKYSETQKGEDSSQVFEVRDYVPGDDIRRIHWRLSSKHDELIVKEYSKPVDNDCVVMLETGILSSDNEERKLRADSMMSVFMKLAFELIENEQAFSVYWYSYNAESLVCFDVKTFDDAAPVIEKFLRDKFFDRNNITFYMSEEERLSFYDKQVYYLYNSKASNDDVKDYCINNKYLIIDTCDTAAF